MQEQSAAKTEHNSEKETRDSQALKLKKLKFEVGQEMGIHPQENNNNS
ncbi:MAG: hypothetical protein PHF24_07035 [Syntrophomonas sp.]|nr:hypothetical protein [Syntrophomonas sp.]